MPTVGIGVVTYNRKDIVSDTIDCVRAMTRHDDAMLVVADDGSSDGTLPMLRDKQVPVVTGINMGIAWNKNRALFLLSHLLGCETVILLEDDARPVEPGWENEWISAARNWGHVNYAGEWFRHLFLSGSGTLQDPVRSLSLSAQCCAYTREALTYGGYYDSRFRGYGHEHVEHTIRLARVGYGAEQELIENQKKAVYRLIRGGIDVVESKSYHDSDQVDRNLKIAHELIGQENYRAPWANDRELRQFRSEIESAMRDGPARFRLHRAPERNGPQPTARPGFIARLFRRA